MRLERFPPGAKVKLAGLTHLYRNVEVVAVNWSGVLIKGSHKTPEGWKPVGPNYILSCATEAETDVSNG